MAYKLTNTGFTANTGLADNTLINNYMETERGSQMMKLKDRLGRTAFKLQQLEDGFNYAITAYIYDDLNRLRYVISPEAFKKNGIGVTTIVNESDEVFKELCFGYHYDNLGRQTEAHVPGGGWKYAVFDKNDRFVMERDEKDEADGFWRFSKYDALGRVIMTGIRYEVGAFSHQTLQTAFIA